MNREEVLGGIQTIIRDVLDDDEIVLSDDTTANDIDGWDSIQNIIIMATIEEKFGIKFQVEENRQIVNVGTLVDLVVKKSK